MTPGQAQLLVYGFGPGAQFEGRLVGAIERIESGGHTGETPLASELVAAAAFADLSPDLIVAAATRGKEG